MGEQAGAGFQKEKAKRKPVGGVAQLGEHLPCKQGVKSSNLSISTCAKAMRSGGSERRRSGQNKETDRN